MPNSTAGHVKPDGHIKFDGYAKFDGDLKVEARIKFKLSINLNPHIPLKVPTHSPVADLLRQVCCG